MRMGEDRVTEVIYEDLYRRNKYNQVRRSRMWWCHSIGRGGSRPATKGQLGDSEPEVIVRSSALPSPVDDYSRS